MNYQNLYVPISPELDRWLRRFNERHVTVFKEFGSGDRKELVAVSELHRISTFYRAFSEQMLKYDTDHITQVSDFLEGHPIYTLTPKDLVSTQSQTEPSLLHGLVSSGAEEQIDRFMREYFIVGIMLCWGSPSIPPLIRVMTSMVGKFLFCLAFIQSLTNCRLMFLLLSASVFAFDSYFHKRNAFYRSD